MIRKVEICGVDTSKLPVLSNEEKAEYFYVEKAGYDFDGWYKDETFTEKWNPDTDKVTSDIMLYAKWAKKVEPTKADTPETKVDTPKAATTPTNTAKSPATGDAMHKYIAFFLMIFAALGMICLRFIRKKDLR